MYRKKKTINRRKGLKTLQWTTTLSALRQNSECGVVNVRTADYNQLFSFCAWPEQKMCFRYAVVVAPVVVLKVSIFGHATCFRHGKFSTSALFKSFFLAFWASKKKFLYFGELRTIRWNVSPFDGRRERRKGGRKNNATTIFGLCTFHNNTEMRSLCALKGHCHAIWQLYKRLEEVFASIEFQN